MQHGTLLLRTWYTTSAHMVHFPSPFILWPIPFFPLAIQVLFIRNLQRYGKGFFAINEWGAGPDYHLNPSGQPHNITKDIKQFVAASFMMVNGGTCGVYLTCIQVSE